MNKWQIGPVKLVNGEEAWIDAINEGQVDQCANDYRRSRKERYWL
jgi:hypothetical protein